jgi:CDP-diacylglycerol--glycerol-3-phosphate 3-phosphatidyltransferase
VNGSLVSPATRQRVRDLATPVARGLGRLGLTPNALTVIGFLGTTAAAAAAANQSWLLAGVLVLAFGIFDLFDGTLARATGQVSTFGAFLDSTLDRAGEAVVYIGIAVGCIGGGFQAGAVLAAAAMAAAFMVSYSRAKAESLGYAPGSGMIGIGLAPREVRLAILTIGLLLAPSPLVAAPFGPQGQVCIDSCPGQIAGGMLTGALALIATLAIITTIQRILHVRAQSREG